MTLPLEGIRVVDFCRVLAGPHCGKHLLDLGAEVIKVEPPGGDLSRAAYPAQGAVSGYYAQQNAGKRNISIDLNVPGARKAIRRLCETADVIIENFRPGALGSFGLGYDSVAETNPKVVYASMSGYGQRGSWRSRMAYASTVQAETGFTQNTLRQFDAHGDARRTDALSHADVYTGLHGVIAVLAALSCARVTGQGTYIDVAMAAVMMSINERTHFDLSGVDIGAEVPALGAADCPFFRSPDGDDFVLPMSLIGSMSFPFYLRAMRRPDLAEDPRFATAELRKQHYEELKDLVQTWIYSFGSMAALDAQLDEAKIATGTLRDVNEFARGTWSAEWGAVRTVSDRSGGTISIPGAPWHFASDDGGPREQVPAFQGEHNAEILRELGYDEAQISMLEKSDALIEQVAT